jgi:hypothetical protein
MSKIESLETFDSESKTERIFMSPEMRMWIEISFNVLYLIVAWTMVVLMTRRLDEVSKENYAVANSFRWAFFLLALGDSGHVGFRVAAYAMGGLEVNSMLIGMGALATAITVTLFYVLMLYIWKERFNGKFGWLEYILLASVPVRFIVMAFPQNDWGSVNPPVFWGPFRNLFLVILLDGLLRFLLLFILYSGYSFCA